MLPSATASAASAATWTAVDSGLVAGDRITAVDYQGADRFWFATSNGKLRYRTAGVVKTPTAPTGGQAAGVSFNDIAFKPGGVIGIAVGSNGNIWRTADGGGHWSRVTLTDYSNDYECGRGQWEDIDPVVLKSNPDLDLHAVTWGPGSRVFIAGENDSFLRSGDDGASFTEINKSVKKAPEGGYVYDEVVCKTDDTPLDIAVTPVAAGTPNDQLPLYFVGADGGQVHYTSQVGPSQMKFTIKVVRR